MQYIMPDSGASQMMWDAGRGGGGSWVHCACGKDHSLENESNNQNNDWDSIGYIDLNGLLFVYGCNSCNELLSKYENFIWNNRDYIRRYLKIRIDQEKEWADQEDILNKLAGIE